MSYTDVRDAYNVRAAEYVQHFGNVDSMAAADRDRIARWRDSTSGLLLDAGCGPGHWTQFLRDGYRDVLGVDLSGQFLASARTRFPSLSFLKGDFSDLPLATGSVGGVLAWYSIIHAPPSDVPAVFDEFARVLAPGGSLLVGFFDGPAAESFPHAVVTGYFWSVEALEAQLARAGFTVTEREQRHENDQRPHGAFVAQLDG